MVSHIQRYTTGDNMANAKKDDKPQAVTVVEYIRGYRQKLDKKEIDLHLYGFILRDVAGYCTKQDFDELMVK